MTEYWKNLSFVDKAKFIFSILLGIVGVIFATLNWNAQEVHLLFMKMKLPLTLVIIFSVIVGYAISFIFSFRRFKEKDCEIEQLLKNNQELRDKLEEEK